MDFSTGVGIVGVILTILFFVVGYRQTIGARKERARSGNKIALDTLFRRLTLEDKFSVTSRGISRLISGIALEERVRVSDMHSHDALEAILFSRLLASDYLSADTRKEAIDRLESWFNRSIPSYISPFRPKNKFIQPEILLGLLSALAAAIGTYIATISIPDGKISVDDGKLDWTIFLPIVVISITSILLVTYTRFRSFVGDAEKLTSEDVTVRTEIRFINAARAANGSVGPPPGSWADMQFDDGGFSSAIEIKSDLNSMSSIRINSLISRLEKNAKSENFKRVYLVSTIPPTQNVSSKSTDVVKIFSASQMLSHLRSLKARQ